ncbi:MAG: metallophosphoesterase family protein [Thiotrichales bacterium]
MPSVSVCILSDTHGYVDPRITSLAETSDYVLHAGDIGNVEVLNQLKPRVATIAVLGNNDYEANWPAADHETLRSLSWKAELQLPGGQVSIEHGDRVNPVATRHQKLRQRHPDARIVVYGHSHELTIDQSEPIWVLNPGAAGRERTKGGPSCLMLIASENSWNVKKYRFGKNT